MPTKYIPTVKHKPHKTNGRSVGMYHRKHSKKFDKPVEPRWVQIPYVPLTDAEYDAIFEMLERDGLM